MSKTQWGLALCFDHKLVLRMFQPVQRYQSKLLLGRNVFQETERVFPSPCITITHLKTPRISSNRLKWRFSLTSKRFHVLKRTERLTFSKFPEEICQKFCWRNFWTRAKIQLQCVISWWLGGIMIIDWPRLFEGKQLMTASNCDYHLFGSNISELNWSNSSEIDLIYLKMCEINWIMTNN
jgi:hypothetical protein